MDYSDIFENPIESYSIEEIRARAVELREVAKTSKIVKSVSSKTVKKKKATKAELQQLALNEMLEKANVKKSDKEKT